MPETHFGQFETTMRSAGVNPAAIRAFQHAYDKLIAGDSGLIPESSIQPVETLPFARELPAPGPDAAALLSQCVVVKLNGGLGTGMGLERAKSLLQVKEGFTFLDLIARQVLDLRAQHGQRLRFMLMNSFSTSADTLEFLKKYPELGQGSDLELMQSQAPKVDATSFAPAVWPKNPQLEWCPPGHGDIYPSLLGSGWLDRLLEQNVIYAFVSNSDNLGAILDLPLLEYFAHSGKSFVMEVAERTASDRKGGHLARRGATFLLRESAQCPKADLDQFQDIGRHRFFNTNNLWIRLDHLRNLLRDSGGFIPLPIIRNSKTIDPRDKKSAPVIQLETAMGAAIECFENSGAIVVPRSRFAPVKTTSDLLALRSDAYRLTKDWRVVLADAATPPPTIDLDSNHYKLVDQLEAAIQQGAPSLRHCTELTVRGPIDFRADNVFEGKVAITNPSSHPLPLPPGTYRDQEVQVPVPAA